MSVFYKFKAALKHDVLPIDGLSISVEDLKKEIRTHKHLGWDRSFDLKIVNADTNELYEDETATIPRNSSVIVSRIPVDPAIAKKLWVNDRNKAEILSNPANLLPLTDDAARATAVGNQIKHYVDLTKMEGSEEDKIKAMFAQSTIAYHPSNYVKHSKLRVKGRVPYWYICKKCQQKGHWIEDCPNPALRKTTGIPASFLRVVDDAAVPGAKIDSKGKIVVSLYDTRMKHNVKADAPLKPKPPPQDLICGLCKELLRDAVLIPCCGMAYCAQCIGEYLLEDPCPSCGDNTSNPEMLRPCQFFRDKCKEFELKGYVEMPEIDRAKLLLNSEIESKQSQLTCHAVKSEDKENINYSNFPQDTFASRYHHNLNDNYYENYRHNSRDCYYALNRDTNSYFQKKGKYSVHNGNGYRKYHRRNGFSTEEYKRYEGRQHPQQIYPRRRDDRQRRTNKMSHGNTNLLVVKEWEHRPKENTNSSVLPTANEHYSARCAPTESHTKKRKRSSADNSSSSSNDELVIYKKKKHY